MSIDCPNKCLATLSLTLVLTGLMSACTTGHGGTAGLNYHPAIIEKNVDPVVYEKDRMQCEQQSHQKVSNYEPTQLIQFRQCLIDRGYKLLS